MIRNQNPRKKCYQNKRKKFSKKKVMACGCVRGCSYWATGWTIEKDLGFVIEYSYFSTPLNQTNRNSKAEFGNPLEISENHQWYEYIL